MRLIAIALGFITLPFGSAAGDTRTWTAKETGVSFEGELLEYDAAVVKIKRNVDLQIFPVPVEKLSDEDQAFIRGLLRERARDEGVTEGAYAEKITGSFVKGVSKQGLNYQLYGNPEWKGGERYPILIWLHGSGQSGTDNEAQMGGPTKVFSAEASQTANPCFILSPQCPDSAIGWKAGVADTLMALIADLIEHLPIDVDRIYLTGSSMGGFGTFGIACQHPTVFAAAVPLCGGGDVAKVPVLKDLPMWVFHGDKDDMVPVERSRNAVEAIKAAGGEVINYTEFEGVGHSLTGIVYPREDLQEWLFSQRRSAAE